MSRLFLLNFRLAAETYHCKYRVGYMTVGYANEVVTNYSRARIPLETFIADNQYADGYMDFTLSEGYPLKAFRAFVDKLHARGQRWVGIFPGSLFCMFAETVLDFDR